MTETHEINDGHIHEAIDRIDVSMNYLHAVLAEHPLISSIDVFQLEVQEAINILSNLYQEIGAYDHASEIAAKHGLKAGYVIVQRDF